MISRPIGVVFLCLLLLAPVYGECGSDFDYFPATTEVNLDSFIKERDLSFIQGIPYSESQDQRRNSLFDWLQLFWGKARTLIGKHSVINITSDQVLSIDNVDPQIQMIPQCMVSQREGVSVDCYPDGPNGKEWVTVSGNLGEDVFIKFQSDDQAIAVSSISSRERAFWECRDGKGEAWLVIQAQVDEREQVEQRKHIKVKKPPEWKEDKDCFRIAQITDRSLFAPALEGIFEPESEETDSKSDGDELEDELEEGPSTLYEGIDSEHGLREGSKTLICCHSKDRDICARSKEAVADLHNKIIAMPDPKPDKLEEPSGNEKSEESQAADEVDACVAESAQLGANQEDLFDTEHAAKSEKWAQQILKKQEEEKVNEGSSEKFERSAGQSVSLHKQFSEQVRIGGEYASSQDRDPKEEDKRLRQEAVDRYRKAYEEQQTVASIFNRNSGKPNYTEESCNDLLRTTAVYGHLCSYSQNHLQALFHELRSQKIVSEDEKLTLISKLEKEGVSDSIVEFLKIIKLGTVKQKTLVINYIKDQWH